MGSLCLAAPLKSRSTISTSSLKVITLSLEEWVLGDQGSVELGRLITEGLDI